MMRTNTILHGAVMTALLAGCLALPPVFAEGEARIEQLKKLDRLVFLDDEHGALRKLAISGRGYLGIETQDINPKLREHFGAPADAGVLVAGVEEDSPAAAAGLEVGDVLISIDGEKVASAWNVLGEIRPHKEGERVDLLVVRDGRERTLSATLVERERKAIDLGDAFEWKEGGPLERRHLRFRGGRGGNGGKDEDVEIFIAPEIRLQHLEGLQDKLNSIDWTKIQCPREDAREALEKRIEALEKRLQEMRERLERVGDRR